MDFRQQQEAEIEVLKGERASACYWDSVFASLVEERGRDEGGGEMTCGVIVRTSRSRR